MLNFKHLNYFLTVAKEGSIAKAGEQLNLTPQTISAQLSVLENSLSEKLFDRVGRNLVLTESGRLVLSYAEEIFSLGGELEEMVRNRPKKRQLIFNVGITDVVPKSIAYRLLIPAFQLSEPIRIICKEGDMNLLLSNLAIHKLDLIIADEPIPSTVNVKGYSHPLGSSGVSFFAADNLLKQLEGDFPACLNGAPLLLPGEANNLRNQIVHWLDDLHIHPKIMGEFEDSALMKAFGQGGNGVFMAPTAIADEVTKQYDVRVIGQTTHIKENFYSISVDRKKSHPAITAINQIASEWLETATK